MTFADFISLLKKNFKNNVSDEDLCHLLFNSIIFPADLKNKSGEPLCFEKGEISLILNQKKIIPTVLQDHVYDDCVSKSICDYFQKNVVKKIIPDTFDDIFYRLTIFLQNEDLSPQRKKKLLLKATQDSIAEFLVNIFQYLIKKENRLSDDSQNKEKSKASLKLLSISEDNELSTKYSLPIFRPRLEHTLPEIETEIKNLLNELNEFAEIQSSEDFQLSLLPPQATASLFNLNKKYFDIPYQNTVIPKTTEVKISEQEQTLIKVFAEKFDIQLHEVFFSLGDLRKNVLPTFHLNQTEQDFFGDEFWILKYKKITALLHFIQLFKKIEPIDLQFKYIYALRLALKNSGKFLEENIAIKLYFNSDAIFSVETFEPYFQKTLLNDFDAIFDIDRSANFFDYYAANEKIFIPQVPFPDFNRNLSEEWENIFPYCVHKDEDTTVIELDFKGISPDAVIAFPTVILLKRQISSIKFEIFSQSTHCCGYLKKLNFS